MIPYQHCRSGRPDFTLYVTIWSIIPISNHHHNKQQENHSKTSGIAKELVTQGFQKWLCKNFCTVIFEHENIFQPLRIGIEVQLHFSVTDLVRIDEWNKELAEYFQAYQLEKEIEILENICPIPASFQVYLKKSVLWIYTNYCDGCVTKLLSLV